MEKNIVALFASLFAVATAYADITSTVAHWTYDTPTLTIVGGNITGVADSTGNHNASPGSALGAGTLSSNAIPAGNSVAGQFGQGLTLSGSGTAGAGGGQFLMFPEITQIMAANSAPNYTVSMWVNASLAGFNGFTTLSDWGNSNSTPGRFSYAFAVSGASQMRAQSRFDNGGAAGGDIFARAVTTPAALNNAGWHMLTWTFDTSTGMLGSYFDGGFVETFTSTAASFQMVTASSAFGTLGFKGDSGNFINGSIIFDEMYVFTGAASDPEILNLYNLNAIPEPGSCALAALGTLLFGRRRRKLTIG